MEASKTKDKAVAVVPGFLPLKDIAEALVKSNMARRRAGPGAYDFEDLKKLLKEDHLAEVEEARLFSEYRARGFIKEPPGDGPKPEVMAKVETAGTGPAPSEDITDSSSKIPIPTEAVIQDQVAVPLQSHKKPMDGTKTESKPADPLESLDQLIEEMRENKDKFKAASSVEKPEDHTSGASTDVRVSAKDVAAALDEIEDMVGSDVAPIANSDPSKDKADGTSAMINGRMIVTSESAEGLADSKSEVAPVITTSEALVGGGHVFNPAAQEFVPAQNGAEESPQRRKQRKKGKKGKGAATAKVEAPEAPVAQSETTTANASTPLLPPVAVEAIEAQTRKPRGEPDDQNVATKDAAGQTKPVAPRNPNFAAAVRAAVYGNEEGLTRLVEDMDRSERDGGIDELCVVCEEQKVSYCNRCMQVRYCSRECQVADWPIHKKICADLAGPAHDSKRPSPDHHRILFFPTYSDKPELLWAMHRETPGSEWVEFEHSDLDTFYQKAGTSSLTEPRAHTILNLTQSLENRRIGHKLTAITHNVVRPGRDPVQPALINQSINALTKPGYLRPSFGPVTFFADARRPGAVGPPKTRDITPRDVHSIVRLIERSDSTCVANPDLYHGETVAGLRINDVTTDLNVVLGVKDGYDVTNVPLSPVNSSDYVIALAFHLGLRWYIRPGNLLGLKSGMTVWNDGNLRYLGYVCNIWERGVVAAGSSGQENTPSPPVLETVFNYGPFASSVIVLHGSGRAVDVSHVLAFNAYLDEVFITKGAASRDGFVAFWADYKQRGGRALCSVPSPYKWEKKGVVDRLGYYDPPIVMKEIEVHIRDVCMTVADMVNSWNSSTFEAGRRRRELLA